MTQIEIANWLILQEKQLGYVKLGLKVEEPFYHCDNLKSIKCKTVVPPKCELLVYNGEGFYENVILYVPKGAKKTYMNTDCWGFQNIEEY